MLCGQLELLVRKTPWRHPNLFQGAAPPMSPACVTEAAAKDEAAARGCAKRRQAATRAAILSDEQSIRLSRSLLEASNAHITSWGQVARGRVGTDNAVVLWRSG